MHCWMHLQRSPPSEAFLTLRTPKGLFPRMNNRMSSQVVRCRKGLSTVRTTEGSLSTMNSHVFLKVARSRIWLVALCTTKGFFSSVRSHVYLKLSEPEVRPGALWAGERLFSRMITQMFTPVAGLCERFLTKRTIKDLLRSRFGFVPEIHKTNLHPLNKCFRSVPIHLIRIQHFRLNTDPDLGLWWAKIGKNVQLTKDV